ncbi:hypothetical protein Cob_v012698 [Colletotrichum orbiculare MAFF 240422]|uniref:Uncharacterized protein n=1 Tax=Colletotrichum orbiculare (strain 104-T / ATCC 96160 / CBS 514.97 / LARS 414 / MAFF 240422) TaxID=1213857 RepID=N4V814_COLOR|nr:hypothetical protein Cob_v012698 [Colletotrichum orbiculare MAFF 240422]
MAGNDTTPGNQSPDGRPRSRPPSEDGQPDLVARVPPDAAANSNLEAHDVRLQSPSPPPAEAAKGPTQTPPVEHDDSLPQDSPSPRRQHNVTRASEDLAETPTSGGDGPASAGPNPDPAADGAFSGAHFVIHSIDDPRDSPEEGSEQSSSEPEDGPGTQAFLERTMAVLRQQAGQDWYDSDASFAGFQPPPFGGGGPPPPNPRPDFSAYSIDSQVIESDDEKTPIADPGETKTPGLSIPVKVPPPGSHQRLRLFVRPQRLVDAEVRDIVTLYNELFSVCDETKESLLPRTYRYPDYTRDEAARRRKAEFEQKTGESMSADDFYSVFDLETSTDGMHFALQEWMQGRNWIKVDYVNRIIHQIGRMMYTSAQEEARLRLRTKMESEYLKSKLKDCEKRCARAREQRERADKSEKPEEPAKPARQKDEGGIIANIRNSWQRVGELLGFQDDYIRTRMHLWADAKEVGTRMAESFEAWVRLHRDFISLLDERRELENGIEGGEGIYVDDLERLRDVDDRLHQLFRDLRFWLRDRVRNVVDWIRLDGEDTDRTMEGLEAMQTNFPLEEGILIEAFDDLRSTADAEYAKRREQARSAADARPATSLFSAKAPASPPAVIEESRDRVDYVRQAHDHTRADSDTSMDVASGDSTAASDALAGLPSQLATARPPKAPCGQCTALIQDLDECRAELEHCRRQLQTMTDERDTAETALSNTRDDDYEAAIANVHAYRDLVHVELYDSLQYFNQMFESQATRVAEQSSLLEEPLRHVATGQVSDDVAADLQYLNGSVGRLGEAALLIQKKLDERLRYMDDTKRRRFEEIERSDLLRHQRQENTIRALRMQVDDLSSFVQREMELDAEKNMRLVHRLRDQMKAKTDKLRGQVDAYRKELRRQRAQIKADEEEHGKTEEAAAELANKDAELAKLESQVHALEKQLEEASDKNKDAESANSELDRQVKDLQLKIEERVETERWNIWGDDGSSALLQGATRESQQKVAQLRRELLEAIIRVQTKGMSMAHERKRRRSLRSTLLGCFTSTHGQRRGRENMSLEEVERELAESAQMRPFWRIVDFQRRRALAVSALRREDWTGAAAQIDALKAFNKSSPPWVNEVQAQEVARSIKYLETLSKLKLALHHRADDREVASSLMEQARRSFQEADELSAHHDDSAVAWRSLRESLNQDLDDDTGRDGGCGCRFKSRKCHKHQADDSRFHHVMEVEGEGDVEITQEMSNILAGH